MKVKEFIYDSSETINVKTEINKKTKKAISHTILMKDNDGYYRTLVKISEKEYQGELTAAILESLIKKAYMLGLHDDWVSC